MPYETFIPKVGNYVHFFDKGMGLFGAAPKAKVIALHRGEKPEEPLLDLEVCKPDSEVPSGMKVFGVVLKQGSDCVVGDEGHGMDDNMKTKYRFAGVVDPKEIN